MVIPTVKAKFTDCDQPARVTVDGTVVSPFGGSVQTSASLTATLTPGSLAVVLTSVIPNPARAGQVGTLTFTATLTRPSAGSTPGLSAVTFDPGMDGATYSDPVVGSVQNGSSTTPSVEITVDVTYPSCGNPSAQLTVRAAVGEFCAVEKTGGSSITVVCPDCESATLTVEPISATPNPTLVGQETLLTWRVLLEGTEATDTDFSVVADYPILGDGGEMVGEPTFLADPDDPENPNARLIQITAKWSTPNPTGDPKQVILKVRAIFNQDSSPPCETEEEASPMFVGVEGEAAPPIEIKALRFVRASPTWANLGGRIIREDLDPETRIGFAEATPEWDGQTSKVARAAYIRDRENDPAKKIRFRVEFAGSKDGEYEVRATAGGVERVKADTVQIKDGKADKEFEMTEPLGNQVRTIRESWQWEARSAGGAFQAITATDVRIYVILARPALDRPPLDQFPPIETFYHVACSVPGATNAKRAEADVWSYVKTRKVTRADGEPLTFWNLDGKTGAFQEGALNVFDLVKQKNGNCFAFSQLLATALRMHGVDTANPQPVRVDPKARGLPRTPNFELRYIDPRSGETVRGQAEWGFLVKSWGYWTDPPTFRRGNTALWKVNLGIKLPIDGDWRMPDVNDLDDRPAQNVGRAPGNWFIHCLVIVDDVRDAQLVARRWYDPSYGVGGFDSLAAYEAAIMGTGSTRGGFFKAIQRSVGDDGFTEPGSVFYGAVPDTTDVQQLIEQ